MKITIKTDEKEVCSRKRIDLDMEQIEQILTKIDSLHKSRSMWEIATIIRKTYLGKHEVMAVEMKGKLTRIGLADVKVDKEKNVLTGINVLVRTIDNKKEYMFNEYTFNLDDYRKTWRAWDGIPETGRSWRGRQ